MCSSTLRHVRLVLCEVVQAERIFIAAVVAHNFVGQQVVFMCEAALIHTHTVMPVARHPPVTALDARCLRVDVQEVLVEADGAAPLLVGGLGTRAVLAGGPARCSLTTLAPMCTPRLFS